MFGGIVSKVKSVVAGVKSIVAEKHAKMIMCAPVAAATSLALPMMSFASEGETSLDVTQALSTSFSSMANTMLATIAATLPVVMSVMSAYICINYGIKFFKRFAK